MHYHSEIYPEAIVDDTLEQTLTIMEEASDEANIRELCKQSRSETRFEVGGHAFGVLHAMQSVVAVVAKCSEHRDVERR